MNKFLKFIAFSALVFLLAAAACSGQQAAPTTSAEATALASGLTMLPSGTDVVLTISPGTDTASSGTDTGGAHTQQPQQPVIVTGAGLASLLCQFCVDQIAHAVVVLPQTASFELSAPADGSPTAGTSCNAIEEINGKKIVVCYGAPGTSFEMKVCIGDTCNQFPVKLDPCPVGQNQQPEPDAAATATPPATGTAGTTATTESTAVPSATP